MGEKSLALHTLRSFLDAKLEITYLCFSECLMRRYADPQASLLSQLYFTLGQLEEPENLVNAVKSYETSVALDPTHLLSQRRLFALQSYTKSRGVLSQQFPSNASSSVKMSSVAVSAKQPTSSTVIPAKQPTSFSISTTAQPPTSSTAIPTTPPTSSTTTTPFPSPGVSQLLRKTLLLSLCENHPYVLSRQQLLDCAATPTTAMALSASHCLLARNALEESEAQLRRLYNNGVRQDALFLALGAVLFLKEDSDSLFALLHGLTIYSDTLGYGYLMGLHALLRHDFYEALRHFNLLLTLHPACWQVWVAIGLTRSAMVRVAWRREA